MLLASGYFDKAGNPCVKITVSGVYNQSGIEFEAIIDTGFTGFLLIPIVQALPIGLVLDSTTEVTLADGSVKGRYVGYGMVHIVGDDKARLTQGGLVMLEETGTDILVGMDFFRKFKLSMGITSQVVMLFDEEWLNNQAAKDKAKAAPKQIEAAPVAAEGEQPQSKPSGEG
jgi:predicted aspartyl protease